MVMPTENKQKKAALGKEHSLKGKGGNAIKR